MSVFFLVLIHQIPEALNDLIICKISEFLILCRWFRRDRHKIRILFPVVILYIRFIKLFSSRTMCPELPLTMAFTSPFIRFPPSLQFSDCNFAATASFRDFGRKKGAAVRKSINAAPLALFHMKRTDHTCPVLF